MLRRPVLQIMFVGVISAAVPESVLMVIMGRAVMSVGINPVIVPVPVMPIVVRVATAVPVYPLRRAAVCDLHIIGNGIPWIYGNGISGGLLNIVGIGQRLLRNVIAGRRIVRQGCFPD